MNDDQGEKMNHMSKTKKELVGIIEALEVRIKVLENERITPKTAAGDLEIDQTGPTDPERANDSSNATATQAEIQELHAREQALRQQHESLNSEKADLLSELTAMMAEIESINRNAAEMTALVQSLTVTPGESVFIMDHQSIIRFAVFFDEDLPYEGIRTDLSGISIFELLEYKDPLKLEEKIKRALKGKKEKVKPVRLKTPYFASQLAKVKFYPIVYKGKPAVKAVIKL